MRDHATSPRVSQDTRSIRLVREDIEDIPGTRWALLVGTLGTRSTWVSLLFLFLISFRTSLCICFFHRQRLFLYGKRSWRTPGWFIPTSMMHRSNIQICAEVVQTKLRRLRSEYGSIDSWRPCHAHCHEALVINLISSNMNDSGSTTCSGHYCLQNTEASKLLLMPTPLAKRMHQTMIWGWASTCFKQRLFHFFLGWDVGERWTHMNLHWTQHLISQNPTIQAFPRVSSVSCPAVDAIGLSVADAVPSMCTWGTFCTSISAERSASLESNVWGIHCTVWLKRKQLQKVDVQKCTSVPIQIVEDKIKIHLSSVIIVIVILIVIIVIMAPPSSSLSLSCMGANSRLVVAHVVWSRFVYNSLVLFFGMWDYLVCTTWHDSIVQY